jgi:hypothetical protein
MDFAPLTWVELKGIGALEIIGLLVGLTRY